MKLYSSSPHACIRMPADPALAAALARLVRERGVDRAIETGTFDGAGSTTLLADALAAAPGGTPALVTLEASWTHHTAARRRLADRPFVDCRWGLSLRFAELAEFIERDEALAHPEREPEIFIDNVDDPRGFYRREIEGQLMPGPADVPPPAPRPPEDLLRPLLRAAPDGRTLVLLDSAGGTGWLEFQVTRELMAGKRYFLLLDDTAHLKHYRSRRAIVADPAFVVLGVGEGRDWLLAEHRPPGSGRS